MLILSVQPDATPSKSFENAAFGLAACQNIGINIIPTTQLPKMAERSKKSVVHFYLSLWSTFTQEIWLGYVSSHRFAPRKGRVLVEVSK